MESYWFCYLFGEASLLFYNGSILINYVETGPGENNSSFNRLHLVPLPCVIYIYESLIFSVSSTFKNMNCMRKSPVVCDLNVKSNNENDIKIERYI